MIDRGSRSTTNYAAAGLECPAQISRRALAPGSPQISRRALAPVQGNTNEPRGRKPGASALRLINRNSRSREASGR